MTVNGAEVAQITAAASVAAIGPVATANGVRVQERAGPGTPVEVDAAELGRAMRNLLADAVRHTPSDGTIQVHSDEQGTAARVTISDACGGIPEPDLPHVFDVGFRSAVSPHGRRRPTQEPVLGSLSRAASSKHTPARSPSRTRQVAASSSSCFHAPAPRHPAPTSDMRQL